MSAKDKNVFWSLDSCEFDLHLNALENMRFCGKNSIENLSLRKPEKKDRWQVV